MNEIQEKYLPIGSVVLLKEGKKRLMITGYAIIDTVNKNKIYDYCGCIYPVGIITTDQTLLFNHEDIKSVYAIGYKDEDYEEHVKKIKEYLTEENINNILKQVQNEYVEE